MVPDPKISHWHRSADLCNQAVTGGGRVVSGVDNRLASWTVPRLRGRGKEEGMLKIASSWCCTHCWSSRGDIHSVCMQHHADVPLVPPDSCRCIHFFRCSLPDFFLWKYSVYRGENLVPAWKDLVKNSSFFPRQTALKWHSTPFLRTSLCRNTHVPLPPPRAVGTSVPSQKFIELIHAAVLESSLLDVVPCDVCNKAENVAYLTSAGQIDLFDQ